MSDFPTARRKTAQLAARQYGHVTRAQLLELGLRADTIEAWVRDQRLVRVHQGVYAVGYRRVEPVARALAAVLACGPGGALSHDSALALWGLRRWPDAPEVIARGCVRRPGIRAHRSRTLTASEITVQLGVRTTRAARALKDVRSRLTRRQLTRITNSARLAHILTDDETEALLHHRRNPTRSGREDAFQRWIERHDLPQPILNTTVAGHEVDAWWPQQRVIVEVDDYATHGDRASFQSDRDRDIAHTALGIRTLRLTRERFDLPTAAVLREMLAFTEN